MALAGEKILAFEVRRAAEASTLLAQCEDAANLLQGFATRTPHRISSREAREGRGYQARAGQRAEAYLNGMLSTVRKRNAADAALSRLAAESW